MASRTLHPPPRPPRAAPRSPAAAALACAGLLAAAGCGARTAGIAEEIDASVRLPEPERCNGLDDDLDGRVDEDFRPEDAAGLYVDDAHCGACGRPCGPGAPPERGTSCQLVEGVPTCAAVDCDPGFAPSRTGRCVPFPGRFCLPCADDGDCGDLRGATCADLGGEPVCTVACGSAADCPSGTACRDGRCAPTSGSCRCGPGDDFVLACVLDAPDGGACLGTARCEGGVLGACAAGAERCNGVDDDCDGEADEGFRDARGAYSLDPAHCGACGVSCLADAVPEGDLVCGGDPFAPSCVLACPDTDDGVGPGDRVDADRDVANGCECTVSRLDDAPGPPGASGDALDVDCDGADGDVTRSVYVAPDGDDGNPGSPTRPLRTLAAAMDRAAASLEGAAPRADVFVAAGVYGETLRVPDGVRVHGGYRRDFLALEPEGFRSEVRAPADTAAPGGAALLLEGAGARRTVVAWLDLRGRDATAPGAPAFGAVVVDPGASLVLRDLVIRAGLPGGGLAGRDGTPGASPTGAPTVGGAPRVAVEDDDRLCVDGPSNRVAGGAGGAARCGDVDVGGGAGGSSRCPDALGFPPSTQPAGRAGASPGAGTPAGAGGAGGMDAAGPIFGFGCPSSICCGLADFTVPTGFTGPVDGAPGASGRDGAAGSGCADPLGGFAGDLWRAGAATAGTGGTAGAGGGGGGAGGGAEMDWTDDLCEFPDGLGGGGGGGGGAGCGGAGGRPGSSGGVSIALLVRTTAGRLTAPTVRDLRLRTPEGARGGDGGAGGEGGRGSRGAAGGSLPRADRTTPPLAGAAAGARGGDGGEGGAGGGGGGGCGGSTVGIWVTGDPGAAGAVAGWRTANTFELGQGGPGGPGGGGAAAAADGADGLREALVVR